MEYRWLDEEFVLQDMLLTEEYLVNLYQCSILNASSKTLKNNWMDLVVEEFELSNNMADELKKHGFLTSGELVSSQQINQVLQQQPHKSEQN